MRLGNFSVLVSGGDEKSTDHVRIEHGKQYTIKLGNHSNKRCDVQLSVDGDHLDTFRLAPNQTLEVEGPTSGDRGKFTAFAAESDEGQQAGSGGVTRSNRGLIVARFMPEYAIRALGAKVVDYQKQIADLEAENERLRRQGPKPWRMPPDPDSGDPLAPYRTPPRPQWIATPETGGNSVLRSMSCSAEPQNSVSMSCGEKTSGGIQLPNERSAVTGLTGRNDQQWWQAEAIDHDSAAEVVITLRLVAVGCDQHAVRPIKKVDSRRNDAPRPVRD